LEQGVAPFFMPVLILSFLFRIHHKKQWRYPSGIPSLS